MKKHLIIISLAVLALFAASCSANRGFVSSPTRADIRKVQQFDPLSYVGVIEKGNNVSYNDSLSVVARELFQKELSRNSTLPKKEAVVIEDSLVYNRVQNEIFALMRYVEGNVKVKTIPIPPVIDSILEARGERFGLVAYNQGFTRTGGNYAGQVAKGVAIGLLTLGSYYTVPYKDKTRCGLIILDSKLNNIAYVATTEGENHPLKANTYRNQLKKLLKKYKK